MPHATADNGDEGGSGADSLVMTAKPALDPAVGSKYRHRQRHRDRWSAKWRGQLAMLSVLWSLSSFSFLPLGQESMTVSFTVAVFFTTVFLGVPLFFIEGGIGQLTDASPVVAMRELCPALGGVGFVITMQAAVLTLYYSMCSTWAAYYLYKMFVGRLLHAPQVGGSQSSLSTQTDELNSYAISGLFLGGKSGQSSFWSIETCRHEFNTYKCLELQHPVDLANNFTRCHAEWEHARHEADKIHDADVSSGNYSAVMDSFTRDCISSGEEFFVREVLDGTESDDWIGVPHYPLVITVGLVWLAAFFCCFRSVHSVEWASNFGVILPAGLLAVLSVRCLLIPLPDWGMHLQLTDEITKRPDDKLWHPHIWLRAGEFVVFTLLFSTGDLISCASHVGRKHRQLLQSAIVLPLIHFVICLAADMCMCTLINSLVVVEGNTAHTHLRSSLFRVFDWGPIGMFFVTIPMALVKLEAPLLWLSVFYTMIFCVSGSTFYGAVETITGGITDTWPQFGERYEWQITATTCFAGFAACVAFLTTPAGLHWHTMLHHCLGWTTIMVVILTSCIVFLYGTRRFCYGLARSVHNTASKWRRARSAYWFLQYFRVASTLAAAYVFVLTVWYTWHTWHAPFEGDGTLYPEWAELLNYVLYAVLVSPVFIYPFFHIVYYRNKSSYTTSSMKSYLHAMLRPAYVFRYREVENVLRNAPKLTTTSSSPSVDEDSSDSSSDDDENNNNVPTRRSFARNSARSEMELPVRNAAGE